MKIAICTSGNTIDDKLDMRFGRSESFIIYDDISKESFAIENTAKNESSGAGGTAVRLLSDNNVEVVITNEVGPKAKDALKAFEMKAYGIGRCLTVKEAIDEFAKGNLQLMSLEKPSGLRRA